MDSSPLQLVPNVGAVVIGRNECARLSLVLPTLTRHVEHVVYADSGSTDGSAQAAAALGAHVVELTNPPHSAAKGRQAGFEALLRLVPSLRYVQFIDGDCKMEPAWLASAVQYLDEHPKVASVAGRRREEFPHRSLYNALIDIDWDGKSGPVDYAGPDCLCRVDAVNQIGGWNARLIAGEDPDFGFRLRDAGWENHRVPEQMDLHDVNMHAFRSYWLRAVRAGYCYLEVGWMHRHGTGKWWLKRVRSSILYGCLMPLAWIAGVVLSITIEPRWVGLILSLPISLIYLRLFVKLFVFARSKTTVTTHAFAYALFNIVCKVALFVGTTKRAIAAARGRQAPLIEYKKTPPPG